MALFCMEKYSIFKESVLHLVLYLQEVAIEFDSRSSNIDWAQNLLGIKTVFERIERISMLECVLVTVLFLRGKGMWYKYMSKC